MRMFVVFKNKNKIKLGIIGLSHYSETNTDTKYFQLNWEYEINSNNINITHTQKQYMLCYSVYTSENENIPILYPDFSILGFNNAIHFASTSYLLKIEIKKHCLLQEFVN